MAKFRHLKNAPITEALIDFRVRLPAGFDAKTFSDLKKPLSDEYPSEKPLVRIRGGLGVEAGKPISVTEFSGIQGYLFTSLDGRNVAQFRADGYSFSRLKPYTDWTNVLSQAKRLWEAYSSRALPELITRVAVRYINRLELPVPVTNFDNYLTAPPRIPQALPQEVSQFFSKIVIHETDMVANIVQALEGSPKGEHISVILDIDVFKLRETGFDINTVWSEFDQLRDFKNRIFFESITEETARLYE